MLDKTKVYSIFTDHSRYSAPRKAFRRVKILFEDNISFYIESLSEKDQKDFGKRYSIKKHCFVLKEVKEKPIQKIEICVLCPFYQELLKRNKI